MMARDWSQEFFWMTPPKVVVSNVAGRFVFMATRLAASFFEQERIGYLQAESANGAREAVACSAGGHAPTRSRQFRTLRDARWFLDAVWAAP